MRGLTWFLMAIALLLVSGCEKYALDKQMAELCAKDGGVKVYETVKLPTNKFHENGLPKLPYNRDQDGFGYFESTAVTHVAGTMSTLAGDGAGLKRQHSIIINSQTNKVVAELVSYRRHGGCFLDGLFQGCGATCPSDETVSNFSRQVFKMEN